MLNIAHASLTVDVNGPGRRYTVWVQGCALGCAGCFNPQLQPREVRRLVSPGALAREVLAGLPLDGVTLSGGEPFDQAGDLLDFLDTLRREPGGAEMTAIAFTGYTVEELRVGGASRRGLLSRLDLLVDGPYLAEQARDLPLRGSTNQRLIALTEEGERLARAVEEAGPRGFEATVTEDGDLVLAGFPPREAVQTLAACLDRGAFDRTQRAG